jgi:hypothetical protein
MALLQQSTDSRRHETRIRRLPDFDRAAECGFKMLIYQLFDFSLDPLSLILIRAERSPKPRTSETSTLISWCLARSSCSKCLSDLTMPQSLSVFAPLAATCKESLT